MAQIDMNKLKANIGNSAESKELKASEQPKAGEQPVELINNALEGQKDTDEIKAEAEATEDKETMAIVRYVGSGIWKDSTGLVWKNEDNHKYAIPEYEKREDLKFMVGYGAMRVTFV